MPSMTIVLNVSGGTVQDVFCSEPDAQILFVDWDVEESGVDAPGLVEVSAGADGLESACVADLATSSLSDLSGTDVLRALQAAHVVPSECYSLRSEKAMRSASELENRDLEAIVVSIQEFMYLDLEPKRRKNVHWARRAGRLVSWSWWLTAAVACGVCAALVALVGFPSPTTIWNVFVALSILVATYFFARLYGRYRRLHPLPVKPAKATDEKRPNELLTPRQSTTTNQSGTFFAAIAVVIMWESGQHLLYPEPNPPAIDEEFIQRTIEELKEQTSRLKEQASQMKQMESQLALRATTTMNYWRDTVYPMFQVKFARLDEKANFDAVHHDFVNQFVPILERAKAEPTEDVDPDLVAMVKGQIEFDEALLRYIELLMKYPAFQTPEAQHRRAHQTLGGLLDFLLDLQNLQASGARNDLPEDIQEVLEVAATIEDRYAEQYRGIEIMQARLSERYPRHTFSLPSLELSSLNRTD